MNDELFQKLSYSEAMTFINIIDPYSRRMCDKARGVCAQCAVNNLCDLVTELSEKLWSIADMKRGTEYK